MSTIKSTLLILFTFIVYGKIQAQQFVPSGIINYEVQTNVYKTMGSGEWADRMKENFSKFKKGVFELSFNQKNSMYKWKNWDASQKLPSYLLNGDEQAQYYIDFAQHNYMMQKSLYGFDFVVKDTLPPIQWKLGNETQVIAGYTCRKATGIIMDSVYVFAFYTDEINAPVGPCSIGGLPGAILGLTVPRLYISYIATSVVPSETVTGIKPFISKKYYGYSEIKTVLQERAKEWGSDDEDNNYMQQLIWNTML